MPGDIRDICEVRDTLSLARRMHPGQRNSLDALAKRYDVDNSMRELHGALLDAKILAEVYLAMTGGQASLSLEAESTTRSSEQSSGIVSFDRAGLDLVVVAANDAELDAHDAMLERMRSRTGQAPIWDEIVSHEADNNPKSP
jgi:DNA polymerase-3 subunit epsilon